jgi:polyhydroxyalkanoate synthase
MNIQSEADTMFERLGNASWFLHQQEAPWQPTSARSLVLDFPLGELYHYHPLPSVAPSDVSKPPMLIVYAMVNRPSILDLHPDTSTIRGLLEQGINVYLLEWKAPTVLHSALGFGEYLHQSLDHCVDYMRDLSQAPKIDLMGVCQGGVFALCYSAMFPKKIRALVTTVTPVDFHTADDTLSMWVRYLDLEAVCEKGMNLSGAMLAQVFLTLKPMTLSIQKYLDLLDSATIKDSTNGQRMAERFMAMEQWIEDSPDQPGRLFKEFVHQCYQQNALCDGRLVLSEKAIDLRKLTMPVFNIYASRDHLVPPDSSKALSSIVDAGLYEELAVETGHIGMFVGGRSLRQVPLAIADFLKQL